MGKRTSDRDLKPVLTALKKRICGTSYADTASFGSRKAIEHAISSARTGWFVGCAV